MSDGHSAEIVNGVSIDSLREVLTKRPWFEECKLLENYHFLLQSQNGYPKGGRVKNGWSIADTAKSLNRSVYSVMVDLRLVRHARSNPQIALAKTKQIGTMIMESNNATSKD
jgi:hypothetical protein